jgi:hypothetical protein
MPKDAPVNTGAPAPEPPMWSGERVSGMQTKLHRWAAADPGRRFDDLFNFVHDPATLKVRIEALGPAWPPTTRGSVRIPSEAAYTAAARPAGPAPMMASSYVRATGRCRTPGPPPVRRSSDRRTPARYGRSPRESGAVLPGLGEHPAARVGVRQIPTVWDAHAGEHVAQLVGAVAHCEPVIRIPSNGGPAQKPSLQNLADRQV